MVSGFIASSWSTAFLKKSKKVCVSLCSNLLKRVLKPKKTPNSIKESVIIAKTVFTRSAFNFFLFCSNFLESEKVSLLTKELC
jgi:hypothetical protein